MITGHLVRGNTVVELRSLVSETLKELGVRFAAIDLIFNGDKTSTMCVFLSLGPIRTDWD